MAKVLDKHEHMTPPVTVDPRAELEQRWRQLCDELPDHRVEIIYHRIVISPMPGPKHNDVIFLLIEMLMPFTRLRGWRLWPDASLFLGTNMDRYRPDLTVVPRNPRLWGEHEVHADDVLLAVEVVSPSSQFDDHTLKPNFYARSGVPLCLVVDIYDASLRLFSEPSAEGYGKEHKVAFGQPLELPGPMDVTLDTEVLWEALRPEQAQ
ncbi:Uma2 family endonuclease [Thermopolyspora sp. NPDC052614]|uniref:Uma2 family endonuclease n=1 Tax=Thermopolyspora sp. NPDC052614 TaxID=3155682 RepID=UPI003424B480